MIDLDQYSGFLVPFKLHFGVLRRFWTLLYYSHQFLSCHQYIAQSKQRQDLIRLFGQILVPHFAIIKLIYDEKKLMLNLDRNRCFEFFQAIDVVAHCLVLDRSALTVLIATC